MHLVNVAVVQASRFAEHARFQIDVRHQTAAAAVVHRDGLLGADALYRKEHFEFVCLRILERDEPDGIDRLVIDLVQIAVLLHRLA